MARFGNELLGIDRCPQCGIARPRLTHLADQYDGRRWWVVYVCQSCHRPVLAAGHTTSKTERGWANIPVDFTIPGSIGVVDELPDSAKRYLQQAIDSLSTPDGSVMLAGAAVDAMLKKKGLVDHSVYERIEKAVEEGILTKEMSEWAHAVRLGSNKPRHADLDEPHMTREDAERLVEFARMLGHILFTLPAQVAAGKARASRDEKQD